MSINGVLQGQYKYDFAGRQAIRTIVSTGQTVHSVFDSTGKRIAEYDQASGALLREYVWTGWEPVAVIENGVVYFVRVDHIGRPVFATNAAGAKVWTVTYDPFGNVTASTGAGVPIRFPGQWFQSESGLHQNWMRDYDPTTGRYLQADPLGLVDGASVYGYAGGNPGRWFDPRGEETVLKSFLDSYRDMRESNWRLSDKYFHCRANCDGVREFSNVCYDETSQRYRQTITLSDTREILDRLTGDDAVTSILDQAANRDGRDGAVNNPTESCQEICEPYRPAGLPRRY
jgi:RHS repeat-associated protein